MKRLITAALAVALGALVLAACGGGADKRPSQGVGSGAGGGQSGGGGGSVRIALPTAQTSFANADVVVAEKQGFFKEEGLKVSVQNFGSGQKAVQAVIGGGADIGGSSIEPVAAAAARGQKVKVIGAYADRLTSNLTTPGSIGSVKELKGKPVGIQDVGAFRELMVRYVLQRNGMTPEDVSYRPVQASGYTGALLAGQIDAAILQQEQYFAVKEKKPAFHSLADLYKLQPDYFYGTYFAKEDWIGAHSKQATAFAAALIKAHRFMYDNQDETVKIAAEATGFDEKAVTQAYDVLMRKNDVFPVDAGLDRKRIEYTLGELEKLKSISGQAPAYDDFVDTAPGAAALKKVGGSAQRGGG
jgi:NitT/TauT family transport system substrate-binding protein